MADAFVPQNFQVPERFEGDGFHLEPLGSEHNERDHAAWMSSIGHISATPGFADWDWPHPMSLADNLKDLEMHARDFVARTGFTYSILDGDDVIGCVYIYPVERDGPQVSIRSWVTEDRADMDVIVWQAISTWLMEIWPFDNVDYAART